MNEIMDRGHHDWPVHSVNGLEQKINGARVAAAAHEVVAATASIWAALMLSRVLYYGLEHLQHPDIVPPVLAHAIQGIALLPCVVVGGFLTVRTWRCSSAGSAVAVAVATSLVVGVLAGLVRPTAACSRYCWLSVIVEFDTLYMSCLAAVVGFVSLRTLARERLTRLSAEAGATRSRLRVLRAQLNPHFLFNALNGIASLSEAQHLPAQRLVVQLSDLLRRTLRATECEEHLLSEELAYSETYLQIQQVRLPSRLRWRIRTDPRCSAAQVPSLILLPLVENAVVHGPRGGMHVVEIDIDVACPANHVVMTVTNTCHASPMTEDAHTGFGLRNVREWLEILYGSEATLLTQFMTASRFQAVIHLPAPRCPVQMLEPWESQCES